MSVIFYGVLILSARECHSAVHVATKIIIVII